MENLLWKALKRKRKKVCILGLDGTPYSLLKTLAEQDELPNLKHILTSGSFAPMSTALPEVSSVAWTSFMTGKNPGKHGIYGFADLLPNSYKIFFPNSSDIRSETLWDVLGRAGKRSVIVNVPSTYPARELNGTMISGFVALDLEKAVYPQALVFKLRDIDYRIDVDLEKAQESKEYLLEDLDLTLKKREQTILDLMDNEEWDLFIGVITETDRLHHFMWAEYENEASRYRPAFVEYYKKIDTMIGRIYQRLDQDTLFIILSDHGFCLAKKQVYLNHWLHQNGYLNFTKDNPEFVMDVDGSRTKAFCLDPSRIYINSDKRFAEGSVKRSSYEALVNELTDLFFDLKISNGAGDQRVIKDVYAKEEIYSGPYLDFAPDLVVVPEYGWDLKGSVAKKVLADSGPWTGMHTSDNAVLFVNQKLDTENLRIFDVMPTVLSYLGVGIQADVDGRVLL